MNRSPLLVPLLEFPHLTLLPVASFSWFLPCVPEVLFTLSFSEDFTLEGSILERGHDRMVFV